MKPILGSLLIATLPFGSVLAAAPKSKKVTLVYQHELPNVPGKSIKAVLAEYGAGSPGCCQFAGFSSKVGIQPPGGARSRRSRSLDARPEIR
jgi:hypothetical protein